MALRGADGLRDRFGVKHVLIDLRHLGEAPPTYFPPFDAWIESAREAMRKAGSEVLRQLESGWIFRRGDTVILDPAQITAEGAGRPADPGPPAESIQ
jgi:hypothetical protein